MNPHAHHRLRKAFDTAKAGWIEVSADDVLEACAAIAAREDQGADEVTIRLTEACQKPEGWTEPRRGQAVVRKVNLSRKDLEHLLGKIEAPVPVPVQEPAKAIEQPAPAGKPMTIEEMEEDEDDE